MRYTNVTAFAVAIVAARSAALEPVPAHCLRVGHDDETALATGIGDFNSYSGGFPAQIFDPLHYGDVGHLAVADLGEAQDCRETLAGYGLWFDDWTL